MNVNRMRPEFLLTALVEVAVLLEVRFFNSSRVVLAPNHCRHEEYELF